MDEDKEEEQKPREKERSVAESVLNAQPLMLLVPEHAAEAVRHELQDISNAYDSACEQALETARRRVAEARAAYHEAIGQCAVERDTAVEEVMRRYASVERSGQGAARFPEPRDLNRPAAAPLPQVMIGEEVVEIEDEDDMGLLAAMAQEDREREEEAAAAAAAGQRPPESEPAMPPPPRPSMAAFSPVRPMVGLSTMNLDTPRVAEPSLVVDLASSPSPLKPPKQAPPQSPPIPAFKSPGLLSSQPPDFDAMTQDELKAQMLEFGLNAAPEKVMRENLRKIWEFQHAQACSESLRKAQTLQSVPSFFFFSLSLSGFLF